jgi:poly-gamma-glutamate capsule biosynthesis protein CapA/YwtB (metallophosphatase superfamily)
MKPFTVALLGDLQLGRLVSDYLKRGAPSIWGNTLEKILDANIRIANLECAFTKSTHHWTRTPKTFHFKSNPENVASLTEAKIDAVSISNNHILDFEIQGLIDTMHVLDEKNIKYSGAGITLKKARAPAIISVPLNNTSADENIRIAIISATDNEPSWMARDDLPESMGAGVNYLTATEHNFALMQEQINEVRPLVDIIIFSYHVGGNWVKHPSQNIRTFAHKILDLGIDIYFGHSNHVPQGVEIYVDTKGRMKPIIYQAGDFVCIYNNLYNVCYLKNIYLSLFTLHYILG